MRKFWIVTMASLGLAVLSATAESMTMDQAVTEALAANIGLSAERIKLGTKERDKNLAYNRLYPSISAGAQILSLNNPEAYNVPVAAVTPAGQTVGSIRYYTPDATNLGVTISAQFALSAASILAIRQTAIDYDDESIAYEIARQRLTRDVKKLFFQLLVIQETIKVNRMQLDNAAERYRQALLNADNGSVPELTVLSAKVAWENKKPALDDLTTAYDQTLFGFESLLGREPDSSLVLEGTPDIAIRGKLPDAKELTADYLERRLDV